MCAKRNAVGARESHHPVLGADRNRQLPAYTVPRAGLGAGEIETEGNGKMTLAGLFFSGAADDQLWTGEIVLQVMQTCRCQNDRIRTARRFRGISRSAIAILTRSSRLGAARIGVRCGSALIS